jgi:uncharacterized protein (DUF924 family)
MAETPVTPQTVLDFWFGTGADTGDRHALWFGRDPGVDAEIRSRFLPTHEAAHAGGLDHWLEAADSTLALAVVLDQFPRNMFRDSPRAFAADARARTCARTALDRGFDQAVAPLLRTFYYLPFEHSEDLADQRLSVKLFAAMTDTPSPGDAYDYALRHYCIIARFGRFPHRNRVLGRTSTPEERLFLSQPGSRF